ncbi:MAG TPA: S8 family serine peptidase [Actinomycetota bacterium]|nr:S8 family serine peptidase [Actinomycetota bacterium]
MRTTAAVALALLLAPAALATPVRASFTPNDPLAGKQFYLAQDHAFDAFGGDLPDVSPVRVAIIDSGLDGGHPEFPRSRIWAARSWVGGSALTDEEGHGTFVAGVIAATLNNNEGIAGMAFPAQLVIAKIARSDQTIEVRDEAEAIRWAVDMGARVINLSIGGLRDPFNARRDTFSRAEASAIAYAVKRGAVLVAAVGNSDEAPKTPWPYASYPAALPHVLGVSALTPSGSVPSFSNRDRIYNDISAPGQEIYSTLPRALTSFRPLCQNQGYSDCGPDEFRHAAGTSFAAPQVTAAAAVLLALKPSLQPDQVVNILERSATDVNASNGCKPCPLLRDPLSGWGRLDVARAIGALDGVLPSPDHLEPNDDAGGNAARISARVKTVKATIDFWDDQVDVYRMQLRKRQRVVLTLNGPAGTSSNLLLWRPGTKRVGDLRTQHLRAAQSIGPGSSHRLGYRASATGWYYIEVKLPSRGVGPYELMIARR